MPPEALPLLEKALAARPDDLQARVALGYASGAVPGRESDGLAAFEEALAGRRIGNRP